jgi:glutamate dehydrogenase/leucine dehydrogenase
MSTSVSQIHPRHTDDDAAGAPRLVRLSTVDGFIAFDLPDAAASGGGTRLASDIGEGEVLLLARAMTYKLAAVGLRVGGAKIGLRARPDELDAVLARFRAEIAPLLASGRLMTGPDMGTRESDFHALPVPGGSGGIAALTIDGVPAEEYLTGFAAAVAIEAALSAEPSALAGRSVALEGFGKVGSGVAREVARRGGRIVAVSTVEGCVVATLGGELPVDRLLEARDTWGDALVHHLGLEVRPCEALWRVDRAALPGIVAARRVAAAGAAGARALASAAMVV